MERLTAWFDQWERDIAAAVKKREGSLSHTLLLMDSANRLRRIRAAVAEGDMEKAVLWTADFVDKTHRVERLFRDEQLREKVQRETRARPGAASWKDNQKVYALAIRYFFWRRRHVPNLQPGTAARLTSEYCIACRSKGHARYPSIPTIDTIKDHIKRELKLREGG